MPIRAALLGIAILLSAAPSLSAATPATDEQVGHAIERMKHYLYSVQDPATGGWPLLRYENSPQHGGDTALVTLALLVSGESSQDPRLARAVAYLKDAQLIGTYAVALRAHVWSHLSNDYHPLLEADARWLLAAADSQARFGYVTGKVGGTNNSTTQYGTLGLWEAAKRGVVVPKDFWDRSQQYFLGSHRDDGGWGYEETSPSYGSMTAAGVTALLIAQQQLYHDRLTPEPQIARGIHDGLAWLDKRFQGDTNPGSAGWNSYYFYAIERVALASGVRQLNGQDWFQAGARYLLAQQVGDDGSPKAGSVDGNPIDTAFALLFLSRGRVPVWLTKLSIPGRAWNNRPNDANALSNYLTDLHEAEVNWQTLSIDAPAEEWIDQPVAYLASDEAIDLTPAQTAAIKHYLDMGGTLLANPDNGSERFSHSIRRLAKELYPQWPMRRLPGDHPLFSSLHHIPNAARQVWGVSNGARELVLMADRDWGFTWQSEQPPGQGLTWKIATNLWVLVSDRGLLPNRLVERFEPRIEREATGKITIGRAIYTNERDLSLPEPAAWEGVKNQFFNRTGLELQIKDIALDHIGKSDLPLIHITGIDPVVLTPPQRTAVGEYLKRGGTLLIETVGGHGYFAAVWQKDLAELLGNTFSPLEAEEPIISGRGLEGGYDNRAAAYRRYVVSVMGAVGHPRLSAYFIGPRPAAILSNDDLSLGMLGVNQWGIIGYRPDAARQLVINILLKVAKNPELNHPDTENENTGKTKKKN